jgi:hypothetical protein
VLRKENPKNLVSEIFSRLNQGAVELEPQEIRHAVYPGTFDNLLQELAEIETIKKFKLGKTEKNGRENEQTILRYFAFNSDRPEEVELRNYESNLKRFFDDYMEKIRIFQNPKLIN